MCLKLFSTCRNKHPKYDKTQVDYWTGGFSIQNNILFFQFFYESSRAGMNSSLPQADFPQQMRSLTHCKWQWRRVKFCTNFLCNPGEQGSSLTEKVHNLFSANLKCGKKLDAALKCVPRAGF